MFMKLVKLLCATCLVIFLGHVSYGQDSAIRNSQDTLNKKLNRIDSGSNQLLQLTIDFNNIISKRDVLKDDINRLNNLQSRTQGQIDQLETKKNDLKKLNIELQNKIDTLRLLKDTLEKQTSTLRSGVENLAKEKDNLKKDTANLKKDSTNLAKAKLEVNKEIISLQSQLAKDEDSLEVIAKITKRDSIWVHRLNSGDSVRAHIKKVNISVREGLMTEIIVKTDFGTFRNKRAIVDVLHIEDRGDDHLIYVSQKFRSYRKDLFVFLDDAIEYDPVRSFLDLPYQDFDALLTPVDSVYEVKESTSVNTYFEIAGYTDIKGISGEPNGIAQFTADAKFITNTHNFPNTSLLYTHFISFVGGLSKFDNDFRGTPIYKAMDSVSRKDLLQRSTYRVGAKVNLLRAFTPPSPVYLFSDLQLNAGFNFVGSKVFDTVRKAGVVLDSVYRTVTQNQIYIEPKLTFDRHKNFSMTLSLPISFISVKESSGIKNFATEIWATPSINLMYFGKRNSKSRLFFRYNHWINLKDKTQAFSQMQLGYALNLTDTWGGKDK